MFCVLLFKTSNVRIHKITKKHNVKITPNTKASSFRDFAASTTNVTNKYDTVIITRAIKIDKNTIMKKVSSGVKPEPLKL